MRWNGSNAGKDDDTTTPGRFARPGKCLRHGDNPGGNHPGDQHEGGHMTATNDLKIQLLKTAEAGYVLNTLPERLALARRDQLTMPRFWR